MLFPAFFESSSRSKDTSEPITPFTGIFDTRRSETKVPWTLSERAKLMEASSRSSGDFLVTISSIIPRLSAFDEDMISPELIRVAAFSTATSRGRRCVPPAPVNMIDNMRQENGYT